MTRRGRKKNTRLLPIIGSILASMLVIGVLVYIGLVPGDFRPFARPIQAPPASAGFVLISPAFQQGGQIPARYTCYGDNVSPPLAWGPPPSGTISLALIVDDPDSPQGDWTHWMVIGLPPKTRTLTEDYQLEPRQATSIVILPNSWLERKYNGPCSPLSELHTFYFRLYALDRSMNDSAITDASSLTQAMAGHILGTAELIGKYGR